MRQSGNESCSVFFSEIQAGGIALGMWCLSYLVLIFTILALRGIDILIYETKIQYYRKKNTDRLEFFLQIII